MHATEDNVENGSAFSFWEPKQYMRTVKRLENANKICSEFCMMIHERAEIEKTYGTNLKKWSLKWRTFGESGLEYGTSSNLILGFCDEADQRSNMQAEISLSLIDPVMASLKKWQKSNFHKASIPTSIKEIKSLESDFEQAQKAWYKCYKSVNRHKKEYYQACKLVLSCQVQFEGANLDPSGTPDQQANKQKELRKIEDRLHKAKRDQEKAHADYEQSLNALNNENLRYIEEMTKVFDRSQNAEKERLDTFKQQALAMRSFLDLTKQQTLGSIYTNLEAKLQLANSDADLNQWSMTHGVDMPTNFPCFEEYSNEPSGLKKIGSSNSNPAVVLTHTAPVSSPGGTGGSVTAGPTSPTHSHAHKTFSNTTGTVAPYGDNVSSAINGADITTASSTTYADPLFDDGKRGVRVRALYDYQGMEDDELSFVTGDLFEKLEDEDEQGWCKGRKDGRVGLYPANYVEVI